MPPDRNAEAEKMCISVSNLLDVPYRNAEAEKMSISVSNLPDVPLVATIPIKVPLAPPIHAMPSNDVASTTPCHKTEAKVPTPPTNPVVMKSLVHANMEQALTAELKQTLERCTSLLNAERMLHAETKKEHTRLLKELEFTREERKEWFEPSLLKGEEITVGKKLWSEHLNLRILQSKTQQQFQDSEIANQKHIQTIQKHIQTNKELRLEKQKLELENTSLKLENGQKLTAFGHKITEVEEALAADSSKKFEVLRKEAKDAKKKLEDIRLENEKLKKRTSEESKKLLQTAKNLEDMTKQKERYQAKSNKFYELYKEQLKVSQRKKPEEDYTKLQKQIDELTQNNHMLKETIKRGKQQLAEARRERSGLLYDLNKKRELVSKMTENAASEYIDVDEGLKQSNRDLVGRNKWLTYRLNELKTQAESSATLAEDVIHRNETLEKDILELKTQLRSLKDIYDNEKDGKNIYELAPNRRPLAPEGNPPTKEEPSAPPLPENPPHSYPSQPMNFSSGNRHGMFYPRHPPNGRPPHLYHPPNGAAPQVYSINGPRSYPQGVLPPAARGYPPNGQRQPSYPPNSQQPPPQLYPPPIYSRYPHNHPVPERISPTDRPVPPRDIVLPPRPSPNEPPRVDRDYQQRAPQQNQQRGRQPISGLHGREMRPQQMQQDHEYYN